MVGLIMGTWFLASGAGNAVAALIAQATAADGGGTEQVMAVYSNVGWMAVAVGVGLIILSPLVKKMMHLDTLEADVAQWSGDNDLTMDGNEMVGERMSPNSDFK